jgi:hypothetical protein
MATTAAGAFTAFLSSLDLTDPQWNTVRSRRTASHNKLAAGFPSTANLVLEDSWLVGSADRRTIIRPVEDVDVLALFDASGFEQYRYDSQKFLYRVRDALDEGGARVAGARGQCVRIFYQSGPKADIAPVFRRSGGGFLLPKGDGGWLATDPDYHDTYISQRNAALGYHLKPLARMIKAWNRAHSQRLTSFHIECMVSAAFSSMGSNYRDAALKFFDWGPAYLHVHDPAGHSGDLGWKLSYQQEQAIRQSFVSARDRARDALDAEVAGNHAEAIRLWKIVFGDLFPPYG